MSSLVVKRSVSGYSDTMRSLLAAIERRGLTVFARIDHAAAAREVGLELAEEEVVLFGNPRAGTPLMQSDRRDRDRAAVAHPGLARRARRCCSPTATPAI